MSLRAIKRASGSVLPMGWHHAHEGELSRCPYPDCGRGWMKVAIRRVISTRLPGSDVDPSIIGSVRCQSCRRDFDVAAPEANPKILRVE